jgi:hypothetical protein
MPLEGCGQDSLPVVKNLGGEAVMTVVRRQHGNAAVVVLVVVPVEETLAVGACVFQRAEAIGEIRPVLPRFELAFRNGLSSDLGPAVRLGHAEIGQLQSQEAPPSQSPGVSLPDRRPQAAATTPRRPAP